MRKRIILELEGTMVYDSANLYVGTINVTPNIQEYKGEKPIDKVLELVKLGFTAEDIVKLKNRDLI